MGRENAASWNLWRGDVSLTGGTLHRLLVWSNRDVTAPISVRRLSKRFRVYDSPWHRALDWMGGSRGGEFWALRDIDFEVPKGKCFGVIGNNGAGKSTLLKLLTGTLHPTSGAVAVEGRLFSILELSSGFLPDLTGRQNLEHAGRLLALPDGYVRSKTAEIQEFSELGEFFDRPFKSYSSGMQIRLAFSLYAFLEPDVLLLDEALSVGDIFFQQKSYGRIRELLAGGITSLFVSHDMAAVQNLCDEVLLLEGGRIAFRGRPEEAVTHYYGSLGKKRARASAPARSAPQLSAVSNVAGETIRRGGLTAALVPSISTGALSIVAARVADSSGNERLTVEIGGSLTFQVLLRATEPVSDPSAGINVYDRLGNLVFAAGTRNARAALPALTPGDELPVELTVRFDLGPGAYSFTLGCSEPSEASDPSLGLRHYVSGPLGPVTVASEPDLPAFYGLARLPFTVRVGQKVPA